MTISASKLRLDRRKRCGNSVVHIVIPILPQPAAEQHVFILLGEGAVLFIERAVLFVVDGIVRLVARLPLGRVLARDDRLDRKSVV